MSTSLVNKERFNPSRLSNLAVWLDGADSNTITLSGTTTQVTKWNDKSSNANNFSVQPVPSPSLPPVEVVSQKTPGSYSYTTSPLFSSTVTVGLSGGGGGSAVAVGGPGGGASYKFQNIPANTTIQYTVGAAGIPGNGPTGGGGVSTLTSTSTTIIAGGGGSGIKYYGGNAAATPFGGAVNSDGSAGLYFNTNRTVAQPPAGFTRTTGGGAAKSENGSIVIFPSP